MSTFPSPPDHAPSSLPLSFAAVSADPSELDLVGSSAGMRRLRLQVNRIGPHFRTVLIRGEQGTEKERVARRLHGLSPGATGAFVRCHAGALEDAFEEPSMEVFRPYRLDSLTRMAEGGTLFVEGVEELPLAEQAKLLRTLRRHESAESGGKIAQKLATRVIASTGEELRVLASAGRFNLELYQRLATVEIALPPLRKRIEDIPDLVHTMLVQLAISHGCPASTVSPEAMDRMSSYGWPGNGRELENLLRTILLERDGRMIEAHHLPEFTTESIATPAKQNPEASLRLQSVIERHVMSVLQECGGNKLRAAEQLGISRSTLYRMLDAGAAAALSR